MLKGDFNKWIRNALSKSHWNQFFPLGDWRLLFWALASRNLSSEHLGTFRFWSGSFLPFLFSKSLKEALASIWRVGSREVRCVGPKNLSGLGNEMGTWSTEGGGRSVPLFESMPLEFLYYKQNSLIACFVAANYISAPLLFWLPWIPNFCSSVNLCSLGASVDGFAEKQRFFWIN